MPPNQNSPVSRRRSQAPSKPPEAMTMSQAKPIIAVAAIFDLARLFLTFFVFFGPAIAAVICTSKVSGWVGSLWGLTAAVCTAGAAAAGVAVSEVTGPLGLIMADAMGFIGFLVLGFWIFMSNRRLLKTVSNATPQFIVAFGTAEIPLLGALPVFTFIIWRVYKAQSEVEGAALKKWEQQHAAEQRQALRERQGQAVALLQARNVQAVQEQEMEDENEQQQEAANDAQYGQSDNAPRARAYTIDSAAANDDTYIPQEMKKVA
ncbi:MAG: hypothetical protein ACHQU0_00445 [Candidatus Paceibacteria bacterium]